MLYWYGPVFPLDLIYNILNYLTILFVLVVIGIKYKTQKNILLLLIITLLVPFLINGPLMPWYALSDQSKYLKSVMLLRDLNFTVQEGHITPAVLSYIWFISPIPFIENFNALGLLNRLYLSLLIIFLIRKKISSTFIYYLILSPTLLLYSSVALKESIVVVSTVLAFYCIIEKKYLIFWFPFLILFFCKFQNGFIVLLMYFTYIYFFNFNSKLKKIINMILILGILTLLIKYDDKLMFYLNSFSLTFAIEDVTHSASTNKENNIQYTSIFDLILKLPEKLVTFFISPFPAILSPVKLLIFLENLLVIFFIAVYFQKLSRIDSKHFFYLLIFFLMFSSMYALTVVNHGTISRYKLSFLIPFLFCLFHINKKKLNKR